MIRTAVMPAAEVTPQVFVDSTGRRGRLLAIAGFFVALFAAFYIAVVGTSVVQASDAGLSTKATVSTSATTSASASASSSS
ncbi:putative membrane protein [Actinoplanes tereljensis]|uniref:Uncharacterized protein n=1 Tax=Paractinoplanes tereljensis TaxID=571912 RepID=A0A919NI00_9ACTN|nr:hypothetical protein [Actinoplanes tereljensis]GIF19015.1 hypothetical protein Ate02nite_17450 [Actinoplanes tereljensis]